MNSLYRQLPRRSVSRPLVVAALAGLAFMFFTFHDLAWAQWAADEHRILENRAWEDVYGTDRTSKAQGPLAKIGYDLSLLYHEFQDYQARGGAARGMTFAPSLFLLRQETGYVLVDAVAAFDSGALLSDLTGLGARDGTAFQRLVSCLVPINALPAVAQLASLQFARPALMATNVGLVDSQGDAAMRSDDARANFGVNGAGIMVGTLSDSYNDLGGAAADVASGDLPAGIIVLEDDAPGTDTDEGRGMMQIIADVAPGAAQAFHTAFKGQANFAQGIIDLMNAGCDVINDDVIYFTEPTLFTPQLTKKG